METACVVCAAPSDVYCHNDHAYLCHACDEHVHSAHAIASTHRRTPVSGAPLRVKSESADVNGVVPQSFIDKELPDMDLSLSDDAWFTVPDTACSNARGPNRSSKNKDFGYDDLFEFDAALADDMCFGLDRVSSDLLTDCLVPTDEVTQPSKAVPDAREQVQETSVPAEEAAPAPCPPVALYKSPAPTAPAPMPAAPAAPHAYSAYCVGPAMPESIPNVSCYIPASLLPVDAVARQHLLLDRREKVQRFREKKKNRQFKKLIRYASRKRYAEVRPRIKGRFARKDEIAAAAAAGVPLTC